MNFCTQMCEFGKTLLILLCLTQLRGHHSGSSSLVLHVCPNRREILHEINAVADCATKSATCVTSPLLKASSGFCQIFNFKGCTGKDELPYPFLMHPGLPYIFPLISLCPPVPCFVLLLWPLLRPPSRPAVTMTSLLLFSITKLDLPGTPRERFRLFIAACRNEVWRLGTG